MDDKSPSQTNDFDFGQLDEEISQIMSQSDDSQSPRSESAAPTTSQKIDRPRTRGRVMDIMPTSKVTRPTPQPKQDLTIPELEDGEEYLVAAEATPDKASHGYGAGDFSDNPPDVDEELQAETIDQEKNDFDKAVQEAESQPIITPLDDESSAADEADRSKSQDSENIDAQSGGETADDTSAAIDPAASSVEVDDDEPKPDDETSSAQPRSEALLANNLVNKSQRSDEPTLLSKPAKFDTDEYVSPLKPIVNADKKSKKGWTILLIILIIILIAGAAGYYFLVLKK